METPTPISHVEAVLYLHGRRAYFERLARRKYFLRAEDARDATSEALYRVLRWGVKGETEEEVVKYFTTVLKRVVWSRAFRRSLPPGFLEIEPAGPAPRLEDLITARSLGGRILRYICERAAEGSLNFMALKLYLELEHLKRRRGNSALNAVAREMNTTNGAVRERIKRARQELRRLFLD